MATGCLAIAAISCVPLYIGLQIVGGFLSEVEQNYHNAHRTPVRYELPAGFLGRGEIDYNLPDGGTVGHQGDVLVFRIPRSGHLQLRDGYEVVPAYVTERFYRGQERLPHRSADGQDEDRLNVKPNGVGFYWRMNDDANPANGYDDANRQAFFVGTQPQLEQAVQAGRVKPWPR